MSEPAEVEMEPLLVKLADVEVDKEQAADWGSFQSLVITPTTPAQQLLGENPHRKNAYFLVSSATATGFARVGTRGQVMNNQGGVIPVGQQVKYEARQEVWVIGDGTTASITVTVLDHRYK